ncbi:MAG: HYR domain-containing protein, partial [Saprospiraceae bacterium]|nr:HYR domain-containing protein [Saprospiraceae bacterium]
VDCNSNSSTCIQTITLRDNTAPVITCPANATFNCQIGSAGSANATDNCTPDAEISIGSTDSPLLDNCGLGTIRRTWTAMDCTGNTSSCTQTITIQDTTAPTITCPSNTTIDCASSFNPNNVGIATASDNCTLFPTVGPDGSPQESLDKCGIGTIRINFKATDCAGNSAVCTRTIVVQDAIAPTITCPEAITFNCQVGDAGEPTTSDNCGLTVQLLEPSDDPSLDPCGLGTISRTWTAVDCNANSASCVQTITIQDTTKPVITCPVSARFECSLQDAGQPTVSDNCTLSLSPTKSDSEDLNACGVGIITRTWSVADCAGNSSSCDQIIEIYDDTPPVLVCPANVSISCDVSFVPTDPDVEDNCDANPVVTMKQIGEFDGCSGTGTVIIRYTATDACGNQDSCDQQVTIYDHQSPAFVGTLPADITVSCGAVPEAPRLDATDNCSEPYTELMESEQPLNGCPIISRITRTWTAYDACGNTSKHIQVISVQDNQAPILAGVPVNLCDQSMTYTQALDTKFPSLTFYDECTGQTIVSPEPVVTYDCFNSKFELAYTAADQCGNVANFVQDVCIDYMPPMCTIRPGQTLYCGGIGSLRAEIMGGEGPFTYMWTIYDNAGWEIEGPNDQEEVFLRSNLSSARIGLMVTDATGCGSYCEYYANCTNWEACAVDSRMYSMYNGMFCDMSSMYYWLENIFKPGPITIGVEGERSFTVDWDHYNCLYALLSMQGEPQALLPGDGSFNSDCFASTIQLQQVKSSANALANEALTLSMNMRLDTLLPHVAFFDYCVITAQAADCSQDHPFSVLPNTLDTLCLPESISNELDHWPITAQEILDLGNRALAGQTVQISYQDLTRALHMVNETFNNCRKIMRYGTYDVPMSTDIVTMNRRHVPCSMVAYPNPATETSVLQINLDQKREVHLEVFDAYGKSHYQTDFEGIRGVQTKTLDLKQLKPGMYFIQMNSGDLSINTKILKVN